MLTSPGAGRQKERRGPNRLVLIQVKAVQFREHHVVHSAANPGIPCRRRAGWGVGVRQLICVVFRRVLPGQHELAIVVRALDGLGFDRRPAQCRPQQQRRENGNDRDDYKQLDQRETVKGTPVVPLRRERSSALRAHTHSGLRNVSYLERCG
jgi:hypothetical protein